MLFMGGVKWFTAISPVTKVCDYLGQTVILYSNGCSLYYSEPFGKKRNASLERVLFSTDDEQVTFYAGGAFLGQNGFKKEIWLSH